MTELAISENYDGPGIPRYHAAYNTHLPEILAVADAELVPITLDISKVVTNVLGTLPKIAALADELKALAQLDASTLDNLEGYLLALAHAHALHVFATEQQDLSAPADMAAQVREVLLADAKALAARGLISGDGLERLNGSRGYRNIAFDLMALAGVMRQNWERIAGRTALRLEELDRAEALADQLLIAVGMRDQNPPEPVESALIRQRAFSLFVRAYDEVRRAVHFLRWHQDDANDIAPSIYAGRQRRRSQPSESGVDAGTDVLDPDVPSVEAPALGLPADAAAGVAGLPPADLPPQLPTAGSDAS